MVSPQSSQSGFGTQLGGDRMTSYDTLNGGTVEQPKRIVCLRRGSPSLSLATPAVYLPQTSGVAIIQYSSGNMILLRS